MATDRSIRDLVALYIEGKAAESARRLRFAQIKHSPGSEVAVLRRELQKRKKIKPLRRLFAEIPHALQALKPCMFDAFLSRLLPTSSQEVSHLISWYSTKRHTSKNVQQA